MSERKLADGYARWIVWGRTAGSGAGGRRFIIRPDGVPVLEERAGPECFAAKRGPELKIGDRVSVRDGDTTGWGSVVGVVSGKVVIVRMANGEDWTVRAEQCVRIPDLVDAGRSEKAAEPGCFAVPEPPPKSAAEKAAEPRLPKRGEVWRVKQPLAYGTCDGIVAGQWERATGFYSDDCRRVDVEVANGSRRTVWLDNLEPLPPLPEE